MPLFGWLHISLLIGIAGTAALLVCCCRGRWLSGPMARLILGIGLAANEIAWWVFRYSHEGIHMANLPLQLCDLSVWITVTGCLRPSPWIVEFAYFAGFAGAGMALLTPDLWSPWPSYPAIYFFVAHGGIILAVAVLAFGGIVRIPRRPPWRPFGMLLAYAAFVGGFDALFGTNYMYLRRKPENASLLDVFGPWPVYILLGAIVALALFWLLWLPLRATEEPRRK